MVVGGRPNTVISPLFGANQPEIRLRIVLLPEPDGPSRTTNSPRSSSSIRKLKPDRTRICSRDRGVLNANVTSRNSTTSALFASPIKESPTDYLKEIIRPRGNH